MREVQLLKPTELTNFDAAVEFIKQGTLSGEIDPLEALVFAKRLQKALKDMTDKVNDLAVDEAVKYGKGQHKAFGCEFQVKSSAGRWDFSECPDVVALEGALKEAKEQAKQAYKSAQSGSMIVSEDTGEVISKAHFNHGKDTVSIKF